MPERTYMVVDRRHDHSFRVPWPDLSARLGTPNACNDCHGDKSAQWAASAIAPWRGANRKEGREHVLTNKLPVIPPRWRYRPLWGYRIAAAATVSRSTIMRALPTA